MTSTQTKLTVTKEMGIALDSVVNSPEWTSEEIMERHFDNDRWFATKRQPLNNISTEDLVRALFIGYEVEKPTGVELVTVGLMSDADVNSLISRYEEVKDAEFLSYRDGIKDGIRIALSQLNIEVVGIN